VTRVSGKRICVASSARDEEVPAPVDDIAAELVGEVIARLLLLIQRPPRAVLEPAFLPALGAVAGAEDGCNDDEFVRDAPRLSEEAQSLRFLEVTVEVAREDALEHAVFERQLERIALHEASGRRLRSRDVEHSSACVETDHLAAEAAC